VTEVDRVWRREEIPVGLINPFQLLDDPNDHEGEAKVESIRQACRLGVRLPHVVVLHEPADQEHPCFLIEGRHRYNARHRERLMTIRAFVAHVGCCGGPAAAMTDS
jgi:sugar phosphate isomerase/epimerase